jgi:hypothetical protein
MASEGKGATREGRFIMCENDGKLKYCTASLAGPAVVRVNVRRSQVKLLGFGGLECGAVMAVGVAGYWGRVSNWGTIELYTVAGMVGALVCLNDK